MPSGGGDPPSRVAASLRTTHGRPVRRWVTYGASCSATASSATPTSTSMPAWPQCGDPPPVDLRVGVGHADDHPGHAGGHHGVGARRRPPVVGARLERHVEGARPGPGRRPRPAPPPRRAGPGRRGGPGEPGRRDWLRRPVGHQHGSHPRVGRGASAHPLGGVDGPQHPPASSASGAGRGRSGRRSGPLVGGRPPGCRRPPRAGPSRSNTAEPATNTLAPARVASTTVSLVDPAVDLDVERPGRRRRRPSAPGATLGITSAMNDCPPNPGKTVMHSTRSTRSR